MPGFSQLLQLLLSKTKKISLNYFFEKRRKKNLSLPK